MSNRVPILLVDDQRFVAIAVGRLLEEASDVELHCCDLAVEALATAQRIAPGLILQDLVLPEIDGLSLVREFRRHSATAATPIVVLSGKDDEETRQEALAAGADDFLVKLPSRDVLVACVRRHLASGLRAPAAARTPTSAAAPSALQPTLDRGVIAALCGGRGASDFAATVIDQFMTETALLVEQLLGALRPLDASTLRRAAHSLRGTAMTMGAHRLASLSGEAEAQAGRPTSGVDLALVAAIQEELARVHSACTTERARLIQEPVRR